MNQPTIMKKKLFKIIKWSLIFLMTFAIITGLFFVNKYWKNEKLFYYKKGTNKKAILNTTWNMSYKEVERANNCKLKEGFTFTFWEPGLNNLLDQKRITAKEVKEINLWTFNAELSYSFFDDRLFRFTLLGETYNPNKFDSIAIANLELTYGKIIKDSTRFDGKFLKDSIFVEYRQFDIESNEQKQEHRFLIEVTYQPIFNEIVRIAKKEQQSIFQ